MFPFHAHIRLSTVVVFANEVPMIGEVGEDLEKDFERQLENCTQHRSVWIRIVGPEHPLPLVWVSILLGFTVRVRVSTAVRLCPSFGGIVIVEGMCEGV